MAFSGFSEEIVEDIGLGSGSDKDGSYVAIKGVW